LIADLERAGLGLARDGKVTLMPHNPGWAAAFEREAGRLAGTALRLHHVGSTSVPGLCAKPILDILLTAPSLAELDGHRGRLEALGYAWKGEYGIPGRRYSVLYGPGQLRSYVHLHGFAESHPEAEAHLLFRDYLRAQPVRARAYEEKKLSLRSLAREAYTEAKAPLIQELLREARGWRGPR
jgi:GrpB-like predicted nucleotidyltransferase (UPF0157 family)